MTAWRESRKSNGRSGLTPDAWQSCACAAWRPSAGAWVNGRVWTNLSECRTICDEDQLICCRSCNLREGITERSDMVFLLCLLLMIPVAHATAAEAAQSTLAPSRPTALAPNATYDAKVPTLKAVLGYEPGERITPPEDLLVYLKALHAAAPERTVLLEYARTWERRPLAALVIGSPERIAGLAAVKRDLQRLADPRGLAPAEADAIL